MGNRMAALPGDGLAGMVATGASGVETGAEARTGAEAGVEERAGTAVGATAGSDLGSGCSCLGTGSGWPCGSGDVAFAGGISSRYRGAIAPRPLPLPPTKAFGGEEGRGEEGGKSPPAPFEGDDDGDGERSLESGLGGIDIGPLSARGSLTLIDLRDDGPETGDSGSQ